jgi:hypothetical protein
MALTVYLDFGFGPTLSVEPFAFSRPRAYHTGRGRFVFG